MEVAWLSGEIRKDGSDLTFETQQTLTCQVQPLYAKVAIHPSRRGGDWE